MFNSPYNLCGTADSSDPFYEKLSRFSQTVYKTILQQHSSLLGEYKNHLTLNVKEPPRTLQEYAIELLTLAMTWERYLGAAQHSSSLQQSFLHMFYSLRKRNPWLKKYVDPLRGFFLSQWLIPHIGKVPFNNAITMENLALLIKFLESTGEFNDETRRFKKWLSLFKNFEESRFSSEFETVLITYRHFASDAVNELGDYTKGVEPFLKSTYQTQYANREDAIFCGKTQVEYHINMIASQIINEGFYERFLETPNRTVLVPGCMRSQNGKKCKASVSGTDIRCNSCTPECNICSLQKQVKAQGGELHIVPHTSGFTRWLKRWENSTDNGVVAVACPLNIVVGGYAMRELNIPSQCVMLDFSGCEKHWHSEGVATSLNSAHLLNVMKNGIFSATHEVLYQNL